MSANFEQILGHEAQKAYLTTVLKTGHVHHAYCFSGPEQVGKTRVSEAFLTQLLGVEDVYAHPDVTVIERPIDEKTGEQKGAIPVESIRELREHLQLSSFGGAKKVAVIRDADTMTVAAQNALLKTLEEPSGDTLILLIARDPGTLLPTILSRVVHLSFRLVSREVICDALRKTQSQEVAHEIAGLAAGRPGRAMELTEPDVRLQMHEQLDQARQFMEGSLAERFKMIERVVKEKPNRHDLRAELNTYRLLLHDALLAASSCSHLLAVSTKTDAISSLAKRHTAADWAHALALLEDAEQSIEKNGNISLSLEQFALAL